MHNNKCIHPTGHDVGYSNKVVFIDTYRTVLLYNVVRSRVAWFTGAVSTLLASVVIVRRFQLFAISWDVCSFYFADGSLNDQLNHAVKLSTVDVRTESFLTRVAFLLEMVNDSALL